MNSHILYIENEKIPTNWSNGIICTIFKVRNKIECTNYRRIMLLSVSYKTLSIKLLMKLEEYSEEILNEQ